MKRLFGFGIETRYHGPTNYKGSRVSARFTDDRGVRPIFIDYDDSEGREAAHEAAAGKLLDQWVTTYPYPTEWLIVACCGAERGFIFIAQTREAKVVADA